ncbi:MAG: protein kinase domain-containing protein [Gemmataceae bacterium]
MAELDVNAVAQLAVRVGLVEDNVAKECIYELDDRFARPEAYTRLLERKGLITPFQSGKLLKGEPDGYFLGGYRLLYKIASGSFGRVYRGDDPRSGQIVAVKILRKRWTEDPRRVELFEREGRIGMSLQHPNIVQILAVSKDSATGQYFIVMDFVEGGNLRDILTIRKKIDVIESLRIIEECAAGLAYAYSRGLTHRDIKPTNILISTDKLAKLVDFGLAEISVQSNAVFSDRGAPGKKDEDAEVDRTVDYAGLEKFTGQKKGDGRSDIYFLGTVLFEMLTGEPIIAATRDRTAMNSKNRYDLDDKLRGFIQEYQIPPVVGQLLMKMMAFEPAMRYQSPGQMHEAIRAVQDEVLTGGKSNTIRQASGALTIYVVETNPKLQDVFRDKFKKMGFRVLMSVDPGQALARYKQQPYHAILIDGGTVGQDGYKAFDEVLKEAESMRLELAGILMANEDQAAWKQQWKPRPGGSVMIRPVTMKQIAAFLKEIIGVEEKAD